MSILLVSVVAGLLLDRMVYYQEAAEKSSMEQVALDLRSSVNLRAAELVLENRFAELRVLAAENPMDLLVRKPQNYLGVLKNSGSERTEPGNWYYDLASREVVYYVDLGRYFTPDERGRKRVAWQVLTVSGPVGPTDNPQWARLELVHPYRWF
ncbi:MAG: hypothetical protein ACREUQ_11125 [Burkholderiales bacterium]